MSITVTPRVDCNACRGGGFLAGDFAPVPFGSGDCRTPDTYCDCVLEQLPDDADFDVDIDLKLADEVEQRRQAALNVEDEMCAQLQRDTHDAIYDEYLERRKQ